MIIGFHHVVVFCSDTETSKEWYELAGFEYKRGYRGMHWFALGSGEIMLHPGGESAARARPNLHVAVSSAEEEFRRVLEAGLQPQDHQEPAGSVMTAPVTRPWGDVEFEIHDPDGHIWVFTEYG